VLYKKQAMPEKNRFPAVIDGGRLRYLVPVECERLQGFPDDWTNVPWRGKPTAPDTLRYKAIGNAMAVPVMRWLGVRIKRVNALAQSV
jgi:DNA (cytosine-5)-methyltransferase 1